MNDRTQVMGALTRANEVRIACGTIKRKVFTRETTVGEVLALNPPEAVRMTVYELLDAQRGWGPGTVGRFLRSVPLSESKRVGDLTDRQRGLITSRLSGHHAYRDAA